jgi:hypothetical protein
LSNEIIGRYNPKLDGIPRIISSTTLVEFVVEYVSIALDNGSNHRYSACNHCPETDVVISGIDGESYERDSGLVNEHTSSILFYMANVYVSTGTKQDGKVIIIHALVSMR